MESPSSSPGLLRANVMGKAQVTSASTSVSHSEMWEKNKKYTVYKVVVEDEKSQWFVFRRYNEFHNLYAFLKKSHPWLHVKLPGKKLFGNNFDPLFIKSRQVGLNDFVRKIMAHEVLQNLPEVQEFLGLNKHKSKSSESSDELSTGDTVSETSSQDQEHLNLGPSERPHACPEDFEFLKVIGKGTFGRVLLARHRSEGKVYAVKVLQKKMIIKKNETRHIMAERNVLLQNIHHPFLVSLHFSFQTREKLYFVLDCVNGGELFFHLQKERSFSEPRARFYGAEIASAIGYLHSKGIVYRDLKPENILLDSDGHIVLTDFGLCKEGLLADDTTSTFCGTPEYLAPEVIKKRPYDRSVDWWCLGAVLYEMLTGFPPFYSRDQSEMTYNILHKPVRFKLSIQLSPEGKDILQQLLQKDRENRLGSGDGDIELIKAHPFFASIDWDSLLKKAITPPFKPKVSGVYDVTNIDPEFTKEPVPASVGHASHSGALTASVQNADDAFQGFSYAPPLDFDY